MTILDKIVRQKEKEVELLKKKLLPKFSETAKSIKKIEHTFHNTQQMNIIAEIKRSSPSKGEIDMAVDPVKQAKLYESCGAGAISVLTDETFFNGAMEDLRNVREAVDLPILCKDFMIDPIQIDHAKAAGASIILLIVAALSDNKLHELFEYATHQGLEVLCEVHDANEMTKAMELGATIIGINNRNLKTFDVDLSATEQLASMVRNPDTILISESGIKSRDDVIQVGKEDVNAILVGETLMRSNNIAALFNDLKIHLTKGGIPNAR